MVDHNVALAKVAIIRRCLDRIRTTTGMNPDSLDDYDKQDIFVLNLQRAVQAAIDLAAHVTAMDDLGWADKMRDHFRFLQEGGVISKELSGKLQKMVGFRNLAVHDYHAMNIDILKSILRDDLGDLEAFYQAVLKHYSL